MEVKFKGLTCPGCRKCKEAVAYAQNDKIDGQIRQFSLLLMILSGIPAFMVGQRAVAFGCLAVCMTVFIASFFMVKTLYSHSAVREGFARRWVCHTHLYVATDNERLRLAVTRLVIDYRFGRVIRVENAYEGIVVQPKMVRGRITCRYPPHGERRESSVRQALIEIATYEPRRSA